MPHMHHADILGFKQGKDNLKKSSYYHMVLIMRHQLNQEKPTTFL